MYSRVSPRCRGRAARHETASTGRAPRTAIGCAAGGTVFGQPAQNLTGAPEVDGGRRAVVRIAALDATSPAS
jgi:hypothetical protein